jgi:ring-1,2-phenylacetyl-CoA epoxidase subunit PaaC
MTTATLGPADLDAALRLDVRRLIVCLADTKRILGIRYSDWLLGAPSIEAGIAASGMAQDEWGHARLLYALLKDLDEDPGPVEHDRPPEAYASCDPLDAPAEDWADVVALMAVVDGAVTILLEAFAGGVYEPAQSRVGKMIAEEEFHRDLARAWVRRLGGSKVGKERLAASCARLLPRTLAWMMGNDAAGRRLAEAGVLPAPEALLERFGELWGPVLAVAGVAVPAPARDDWDEARGRGPGHPGLEAVERARGDLNRSLFVE